MNEIKKKKTKRLSTFYIENSVHKLYAVYRLNAKNK